ncbi:TPM domain-containing protein [Noviherbaspirillum sp. CPCC 100848]|uniref:TPM domain-containing protein n=1 Tax=Noviherbaspirillum album TaxID=3080276 RepID=A0ABU6J4Y6_9BURK|nr:TPM domain-containing protein [Noviherbaspirillum sp. CPCC 100848]MEC4718688.1 TPM domain-containing protein [Noviherbaspirillum sp. CPCC 100848]
MSTFSRIFRHLRTTSAAGRRAFPPDALRAIEEAIAQGETRHRAEVRVVVEPALDLQAVLNGMTPRERARELFARYGVWDTEENCGVLVYINLADHQVEIVADRGVGRLVSAEEWSAVCRTMTQGFARGDYHASVIAAIGELNGMLCRLYPDDGSTHNQLSNRPVML